jgi:hypothetical protein
MSIGRLFGLAAVAALAWAWAGAFAEEPAGGEAKAGIAEGDTGIASKYPGDEGIAKDPDVVSVEGFEEESVEAMQKQWENVKGPGIMSLSDEVPAGSSGKKSLLMHRTEGSGGHLYRRLKNESGGWGYDQLFARMYVKFAPDCGEIHHFGTNIGGNNPATQWPMVSAGNLVDGAKSFWTGLEPYGKSWSWDFYTYWQGSHAHGDGKYWGTIFLAGGAKPQIEKGKWICTEIMVKVNDPVTETNGEMAFWIDGKLFRRDGQVASHWGPGFPKGRWRGGWWGADPNDQTTFEGFAWRKVKELTVNYVWLYIYTEKPAGHDIKVWFDDVVVAKKYVGPLAKKAEAAK